MIKVLTLAEAIIKFGGSIKIAIKASRDIGKLLPHFGYFGNLDKHYQTPLTSLNNKDGGGFVLVLSS